jgi:Lrp/AsnC family leucine-responsive transcriptional regulator
MKNLDLKDRKILYELDLDSRQSFRSIGKKVGLSKDTVASRIKSLIEDGIIQNFYAVIDAYKLGYISIRFYLTFQYTNPEIEKEIIDYFIQNKNIYWVASIEGRFDLAVILWVKNIHEFYRFWEKTLEKYRDYFEKQVFSLYIELFHYRYSFLMDEPVNRKKFEITGGGSPVEINDMDIKILQILAPTARLPITEIANKLHTTSIVVKNRIKKLIKLGVIQGFRTKLDFSKLGMDYYKVDIDLKEYSKNEVILNHLKQNPYLIYLNKSVGYADTEVEFIVNNLEHLREIMENVKLKFPNVIKNYKYFSVKKVHKIQLMPER